MKVLVAMSGGVDSSVAAKLLVDRGYECCGCTMRLYENETANLSPASACCSLDDVADARSVAYRLDMPFYVFNFSDEFREKIIDRFIACYECAMTPNPCIDCNRYMKFGKLYERAQILDCTHIATGHYARIEEKDGIFYLKKALDLSKDQSYVLYCLTQEQLSRTLFPLGEMTKSETRSLAEANGFVNARKKDSQDICFVPDGDYAAVIERNSGKEYPPGDFVDLEGNVLGRHKGIIHYTIGQRKGLGLSLKEPMYVCRIDTVTNRVILGRNDDLFRREVPVSDLTWTLGAPPAASFRAGAKIRYRHTEQPATITVDGDRMNIVFDEPQRAPTPGQAAVLYDGDVVLGGGTILPSESA